MTDEPARRPITNDERLAAVWIHRARLINVAFRILGDVGAAEDAVQEAFARLLRTAADEVDDPPGWLIVVTSRLCLDQIRSARSRLDQPVAIERLDALGASGAFGDPADRVTLDDRVSGALQVVLQRLSPAERVVFVMHDVFQIPFDAIADVVGRPASTCRQLATRARHRIAGSVEIAANVGPADPRQVAEQFISACANGDLAGLLAVLDPDASGDGDFGPDVPAPGVVVGAAAVARRTLGFLGHGATVVSDPTTTATTATRLLAYVDRRLLAVIELRIVDGRILDLHADGRAATLASTVKGLADAFALTDT